LVRRRDAIRDKASRGAAAEAEGGAAVTGVQLAIGVADDEVEDAEGNTALLDAGCGVAAERDVALGNHRVFLRLPNQDVGIHSAP